MSMTKNELSQYKQQLNQLIETIRQLAFQCAHNDPLIQGCPNEVYRTCATPNCQCRKDPAKRHGPYMTIQTYVNKKPRQITLRKDQTTLWQRAKNYQKQKKSLVQLKKTCAELTKLVQTILNRRLEEYPDGKGN